jgi:hypothetical protein
MHSLRAGEPVNKVTWYTSVRYLTPGHSLEKELQLFQKMKLRMRRIQFMLIVNLIWMILMKAINNPQNTMKSEFQYYSEFPQRFCDIGSPLASKVHSERAKVVISLDDGGWLGWIGNWFQSRNDNKIKVNYCILSRWYKLNILQNFEAEVLRNHPRVSVYAVVAGLHNDSWRVVWWFIMESLGSGSIELWEIRFRQIIEASCHEPVWIAMFIDRGNLLCFFGWRRRSGGVEIRWLSTIRVAVVGRIGANGRFMETDVWRFGLV